MSPITICLIVCAITVVGFLLNKYTLGTTAMLGLPIVLEHPLQGFFGLLDEDRRVHLGFEIL